MGRPKYRIPDQYLIGITAELGTATDTSIAQRWTETIKSEVRDLPDGWNIDRHTIFWMRKQKDIPSFHKRVYSAPKFKGRFEKAFPDAVKLFGQVPPTEIARKYGVSRSTVYEAAKRLGLESIEVDYSDRIDTLLATPA